MTNEPANVVWNAKLSFTPPHLPLRWALVVVVLAIAPPNRTYAQTPAPASAQNPYTIMAPGVTGQNGSNSSMQVQNASPPPVTQGQNIGQSATLPPTVLYPDAKQYVLTPGDLINVRLFGSADYATVQRISMDGTVVLPLIGSVPLTGITIQAAEESIELSLRKAGMYRKPQITISIAESASPSTITLAGELHGVFPIQGPRPLLDVLASFGGLPVTAGRVVTIIRPGAEAPILVDLGTTAQDLVKANIPVLPHDTVFVERAGVVYVVGAFKLNGAYPLQAGRVTLMQVAALSGGPLFSAKYDDMRIIRTVGNQRTEVKVDIKKVLYGKMPDPILQSGDILFLPPDALKAAISNGNFNTLLGAVSLALVATR